MKWLTIVAKHHKDYVKMVENFGEKFLAEDIVQESYLRMSKYCKPENIITKGKVNKSYVYFVIRNIYLDYLKERSKFEIVDIEKLHYLTTEEEEIEKHEAYLTILNKVKEESCTWHWYDKRLFEIYKDSGKSIRQLSDETNISVKSIFQTLKHCKQRIKENVGEDYQDYKNKEYELIN
jgi:RNA polymerase sigma factor (sigma-70 family)